MVLFKELPANTANTGNGAFKEKGVNKLAVCQLA